MSIADLLRERPTEVAGAAIVERYGPTTALLVKLLDAGSRLPVHVHPTRELARQIFDSQFGKAEAWAIVATRQMEGQPSPRVWLGFREDVSREQLMDWIERQDTEAIRGAMNEIEVKPGDAVFVRPGLLHATGAGVFLVEAQEPTDFSIVAEYKGYPIAPDEAHMSKGWDTMIDIIDRGIVDAAELQTLVPGTTAGGRQCDRGLVRGRRLGPTERSLLQGLQAGRRRVGRLAARGRLLGRHRDRGLRRRRDRAWTPGARTPATRSRCWQRQRRPPSAATCRCW